ncbi:MAG: SCO family protein [Nitrospirae bacterium]|nr:SCO family protein [Nitrospirota bacterium]
MRKRVLACVCSLGLLLPGRAYATTLTMPTTPSKSSIYWLEGEWQSDRGELVSLRVLEGKPVLLAMVYASCKSACPLIVHRIEKVLAALAPRERSGVSVVLATLDPENDTPPRLAKFRAELREVAVNWYLLRGTPSQTRELEAVLNVKVRKLESGDFSHSNKLTVLNPAGEIVHQTEGLNTPPTEAAAVLRGLLQHDPASPED